MPYTVQKCVKCGRDVKIDALNFLLNLGKTVLCGECEKSGIGGKDV
ncbi:hypothetical protein ES703_31928 [subsurface metagenome]